MIDRGKRFAPQDPLLLPFPLTLPRHHVDMTASGPESQEKGSDINQQENETVWRMEGKMGERANRMLLAY